MTRPVNTSTAIQRTTSPALDAIIGHQFPVLDHGFVAVLDYMGNDAAIIQSARVSYGPSTRKISDDTALMNYLMRRWHTSPFEMCEIKLHVKLPIFVARQWVRHRTANLNEISGRYSVLPSEFYVPEPEDITYQSTTNKQGRGEPLPKGRADGLWMVMSIAGSQAFNRYDSRLKAGLAREIARIELPLSTYTEWHWKIDLHNLFHFLQLRADPHAQKEIRDYADAILSIVEQWVPIATAAFREHRMNAATLSATALRVVRRMIAGETVTQEDSGLGKREWGDVMAVLGGGE